MIRILLTVPHLISTASPYREMMALAKYLPKNEFQVTICSLRKNGFPETAPLLEQLGCRVIVARFRPGGRNLSYWVECLKDQKVISQYGPFDIQHSLDFTSSPVEALLSRIRSQRAFIFSQRNLGQAGHKTGNWIKIRLANKIVAISDAVKEFLQRSGADPLKVASIPLGIEQDGSISDEYAPKTGPRRILSVGHIQPLKRQEDAIKALSLLLPEFPDLSLSIAGDIYDPSYYKELWRLAGSLGLEQRVHFLGVRDDVPFLMRESAALLLCSASEAFSWVVLEAMGAGLPVVASNSGGPGEIITDGQTGCLVPVGNIEGYARAIRKIIIDPEKAAFLSKNAHDLLKTKYSAEAMVAQHVEMYKNLVLTPTNPGKILRGSI